MLAGLKIHKCIHMCMYRYSFIKANAFLRKLQMKLLLKEISYVSF